MNTRTPDRSDSPLDGLARDHAAAVFRFLRSLVGDADLARDLVQDTFLKLHRHAHEAGPGAGSLAGVLPLQGEPHLQRGIHLHAAHPAP